MLYKLVRAIAMIYGLSVPFGAEFSHATSADESARDSVFGMQIVIRSNSRVCSSL